MKRLIKIFLLLFIAIGSNFVNAQYDPMFTNYMWNEMYINPGYTGTREAISATVLLRDQWVGMTGSPKTQSFNLHSPIIGNQAGIGMSVVHETIGITNQTYAMGSFAYRVRLGHGKLSMGLSFGILNKTDRLADVVAGETNDHHFNTNTPNMTMPNGSFGLYYYTDKYYFGVSIPRLINNQIVADVGQVRARNRVDYKDLHYFITGGYVFNVSKDVKLKPTFLVKTVYGAPVEADITLNALLKDVIWAGLGYRTGDAASLLLGVQINQNLRIGYSYDYTLTELQKANTGSHEIAIGYDFNISRSKIVSPRHF